MIPCDWPAFIQPEALKRASPLILQFDAQLSAGQDFCVQRRRLAREDQRLRDQTPALIAGR
jgi:hypothetical protein